MIFESTATGEVTIATQDVKALLNDGQGTAASTRVSQLIIKISEKVTPAEFLPPYDNEPPESFTPEVAQDRNIFDGRWFASFSTSDKISGIDYYEISELAPWYSFIRLWQHRHPTDSPYVLQDQTLQSRIEIRAIDRAGNARLAVLGAARATPWYKNMLIWGILIVGFIAAKFLKLWRQKQK